MANSTAMLEVSSAVMSTAVNFRAEKTMFLIAIAFARPIDMMSTWNMLVILVSIGRRARRTTSAGSMGLEK